LDELDEDENDIKMDWSRQDVLKLGSVNLDGEKIKTLQSLT
jgi:hypothetical protein